MKKLDIIKEIELKKKFEKKFKGLKDEYGLMFEEIWFFIHSAIEEAREDKNTVNNK